jgi:hypothetical protein
METIEEYMDADECIGEGVHLNDCDADGYCNFCGHP